MLPEKNDQTTIHELVLENQRLLIENNKLLKDIHRRAVWSFWFRLISFLIIIGVPFVLYYYVVAPYFTTLGDSFKTFEQGLQAVPGWRQFYQSLIGF